MYVKLKGITKCFGELCLFKDFSYDFDVAGTYCISGASGCGKTTLLKIISGIDKDFEGEVLKEGKLSFVFQENRLIPFINVLNNVLSVCDKKTIETENKAKEILKNLGLEGFENAKISELSGGMKRRVSLARALIFEPQILLLDEAFSALDENTISDISPIIKEFAKDKIVIMVTHSQSEISSFADKIIKL